MTIKQRCAIIDLETTGLKPEEHQIIEVGVLEFFHYDFKDVTVGRVYSGLQESRIPLDPEITKITGIKESDLLGQRISWELVRSIVSDCSLIIAHNARFERSFLQVQQKELLSAFPRWGCSMRHIDWHKHGFHSQKLGYLASDHGFLNPFSHRAIFDCATTLKLITPYLAEIDAMSHFREVDVYAASAPYKSKDLLRNRGYRWNPEQSVWILSTLENRLPEERNFLTKEVYQGPSQHREEFM